MIIENIEDLMLVIGDLYKNNKIESDEYDEIIDNLYNIKFMLEDKGVL